MQLEILMATYGVAAFCSVYIKKIFRIYQIKDAYKLIVSEVFKIIGLILLLYPSHFYILLVAQLLLGLSYSIMAGVDTSIIKMNIKIINLYKINLMVICFYHY